MLIISVNDAEFMRAVNAFVSEVETGLSTVVLDACEEGAEEARRVAPKKTGGLAASIRGRLTQKATGEIVASAEHASHVESGTRPHEIRARFASALRWEDGDGVHFARRVQHPGTRPQPFMGPAYLKAERVLVARGETLLAKAVRRFAA